MKTSIQALHNGWPVVDALTPDELVPKPHEFVLQNGTPDTVAEWKARPTGS